MASACSKPDAGLPEWVSTTIILLQTAPIGINDVGWKYYLVIICWCIVFIPMVYFFWPETARLSLEEISAKFGDDVAVHTDDVSEQERKELDKFLKSDDVVHMNTKRAAVIDITTEVEKV